VWRDALRGGPRASLRVKLVAVTLCLLAAGAAVIVTVGASALRAQLTRQAGTQLRAYANQLTSHRFQVLGTSRFAPGTVSTAALAGAPGAVVTVLPRTGAFSIELRGAGGHLLLSAGPGTRPGLPLPQPFARVPRRTGALLTVPGVGGSYLVIAERVHYLARRVAYGYGADDYAVTGGGQDGAGGVLVTGLRMAGIGRAVGRLTLLVVAVTGAVILLGSGLAWAAIRFSLRPVTRAAQAADALAATDLSSGMPERPDVGPAGSRHSTLSELVARFTASAEAEEAARSATGQMSQDLAAAAESLRRPVSVLHGVAEHWANHDRRGAADADRALDQVTTQAARIEALLDQLDHTRRDSAVSRDPG
jgi:signal transduction histidine kinase